MEQDSIFYLHAKTVNNRASRVNLLFFSSITLVMGLIIEYARSLTSNRKSGMEHSTCNIIFRKYFIILRYCLKAIHISFGYLISKT